MFAIAPRVEAFARLRCARCDGVFALIGAPADSVIYRLFFGGLRLTDRIPAICPACKFNLAVIEDADYVMPQLVK